MLGSGPLAAVLRYNILFVLAHALLAFGGVRAGPPARRGPHRRGGRRGRVRVRAVAARPGGPPGHHLGRRHPAGPGDAGPRARLVAAVRLPAGPPARRLGGRRLAGRRLAAQPRLLARPAVRVRAGRDRPGRRCARGCRSVGCAGQAPTAGAGLAAADHRPARRADLRRRRRADRAAVPAGRRTPAPAATRDRVLLAAAAQPADRPGRVAHLGCRARRAAGVAGLAGRDDAAAGLRAVRAGPGRPGLLDLDAGGSACSCCSPLARRRGPHAGHHLLRRPLDLPAAVRAPAGLVRRCGSPAG